MSALEEKLEHHAPPRHVVARRTFASLQCCRGFVVELVTTEDNRRIVSICPMETRSLWAHNGQGRWNAGGAVYERMEVP